MTCTRPARTAALFLLCIAVASGISIAAVAGSGQEVYAQQALLENPAPVATLQDGELLNATVAVDIFTIDGSTYAALVSESGDRLIIVDVTDPASPSVTGHVADDANLLLDWPLGVAVFETGGNTYAAITAIDDDGLQIITITDPASPTAAGNLPDTEGENELLLENPIGVDTFETGGNTYAVVASQRDNGIEIIDVTAPASPASVGNLTDTNDLELEGAYAVDIFETGNKFYAVITGRAESGLQLVDITDPTSPTAAGSLTDDAGTVLQISEGVTVFETGNKIYAAVTSSTEDGLQLVDITDPDNLEAAGKLTDSANLVLEAASGLDIFVVGESTYAVVAADDDNGIQIVDITDPDSPADAGSLQHEDGVTQLSSATDVAVFEIGGSTYAVVAPESSAGIQLVRLTAAEATNSPPVAPAVQETTLEDTHLETTPAISDPDTGDTPRISAVGDPPHGRANFTDTTIGYLPDQDYTGDDSFTYTVTDGEATAQGTVTVTITPNNHQPAIDPIGNRAATVGIQLSIVPAVTDEDPTDTHTFSINRGTLPAAAVFTESDGSLVWTPAQADDGATHTVTITADDGRGGTDSETFDITVTVTDTTPPVITLVGDDPLIHELGDQYDDPGADTDDGSPVTVDSSAVDVNVAGDYTVTYTATDSSSNTSTASRTVTVRDTTPPVITIVGDDPITVGVGGTYTDPGASATDNDPAYDGTVTDSSDVDESVIGDYAVTYTATDPSGNTATASRAVQVRDTTPPSLASATLDMSSGTMEITFDETVDISATSLTSLYVSDTGRIDQVRLAGAALDRAAPDSESIPLTLARSHLKAILSMDEPQLDLVAGAVADPAGNPVQDAPDGIITILLSPTAAGHLATTANPLLNGTAGLDIYTVGTMTYAAVVSLGADSGIQIVDITDPDNPTAAGALADDSTLILDVNYDVDIFETGGRTYAVVASRADSGIQIVDITDPDNPAPAGSLTDNTDTVLRNPEGVTVFETGGRTYAAVTSSAEDGLQIVDITDPDNPTAAGKLEDDAGTVLQTPESVRIFEAGGITYAAVASREDDGLQLVGLADPASPAAAGALADDSTLILDGAAGVDIFEAGASTYAVVASRADSGIQIVDITDPASPAAAGALADDSTLTLAFPRGVDIFEAGASTYAVVASRADSGIQIVDITEPASPAPVGGLADDSTALGSPFRVAVFDISGVTYAAVTDSSEDVGILLARLAITAIPEPIFESAALNLETGDMTITFDETVDISATSLTNLYVSDTGRTDQVQLEGAALNRAAPDSPTVSVTLTQSHLDRIATMTAPQLDMAAGAVSDPDGNAVHATADGPIAVTGTVDTGDTDDGDQRQPAIRTAGGGGGGGSGRTGVGPGSGTDGAVDVRIASISWDCSEGIIRVAAGPYSDDLSVSVRTVQQGVVQATADGPVPAGGYATFSAPMHESEQYVGANALLLSGSSLATDSQSVNVDSCTGERTFVTDLGVTAGPVQQAGAGGSEDPVSAEPAQQDPPESEPTPPPVPQDPPEPASELVSQDPPEPAPTAPVAPPAQQDPPEPAPTAPVAPPAQQADQPGGGCLIATAAYGTELAPQIQQLREIRDATLLSTQSGSSFVAGFNSVYYSFSPAMADMQRENPALRDAVRALITPMISTLSIMSFAEEGSEASVLALGASVILLNLGMYVAAPAAVGVVAARRIGRGFLGSSA